MLNQSEKLSSVEPSQYLDGWPPSSSWAYIYNQQLIYNFQAKLLWSRGKTLVSQARGPGSNPGRGNFQQKMKFLFFSVDYKCCLQVEVVLSESAESLTGPRGSKLTFPRESKWFKSNSLGSKWKSRELIRQNKDRKATIKKKNFYEFD